MKTKNLLFTGIVALVVVIVSACSSSNENKTIKEKYAAAIPDEADIVIRIDAKSIIEKSEFNNSELKEYILKETDKEIFRKYDLDLEKMGFDISKPFFFFSNDNYNGVVFKVKKAEQLKNWVQDLGVFDTIVKEGDKYIATKAGTQVTIEEATPTDSTNNAITIKDNEYTKMALVFDSERGVLVNSYNEKNGNTKDLAIGRFNNDSCKFVDTKNYEKMCENTKDINCFISFKSIENKDLVDYKDYNFTTSIAFERGEATSTINIFSDSTEVQKKLDDIFSKLKKTNGEYTNIIDKKCFVYWQMALNSDVIDLIKETIDKNKSKYFPADAADDVHYDLYDKKSIEEFENNCSVLKQIDGDIAALYTLQNNGNDIYSIKIAAKVKNENAMRKEIDKYIEKVLENGSYNIEKRGKEYIFTKQKMKAHLGIGDDKNLYFNMVGNRDEMFNVTKNNDIKITDDMKKNYGCVIMNPDPIIPFINLFSSDLGKQVEKFNNFHWYLNKNQLVCKMVSNEKENILKTLVDCSVIAIKTINTTK